MERTISLQSLRADTAKENDGDWRDLPEYPGVSIKVRSIHYGPFTIARTLANQKLSRKYGRGKIVPPEVEAEVNGELIADHLILDWKGIAEPFSVEQARLVLTDPGYREFSAAIVIAATEIGRAEIEFTEDARGNSAPLSAGS